MLDWNRKLYTGESITKKEKKLQAKIEKGKFVPGIYLITLASCEENLLEIIAASFLKQEVLRKRCPKIVGLARGKDEALELAAKLIKDTYDNTGGFRVAEYMQDR